MEGTVVSFFGAISDYDYDSLRSVTTSDFELVEDTLVMEMSDFVEFSRTFKKRGAKLTYQLGDFRTEVREPVAWTRYRNEGMMTMGDTEQELRFLESAVLVKVDGRWKIDRLHSTPLHGE